MKEASSHLRMSSIKTYYRLVKPGIVYGNAIPAIATFLYAGGSVVSFVGTLGGLSLSIAGACVLNNVLDRDIDSRMERTKTRALPTGEIAVPQALLYAAVLIVSGFALLLFLTNVRAFLAVLTGVVVYVGLYTPAKRWTVHSTLIGAIAGAVPPVAGYLGAGMPFNETAVGLFLVLATWQMVHFYAIAIFRHDDYRAADLPVMTVHRGVPQAKALMILYAFLFGGTVFSLFATAGLGLLYAAVMGAVCLGWIALAVAGLFTKDTDRWARRMFFYSLVALLIFSATLAVS